MREDVVPYVCSLIFVAGTCLVIAAYGIYRQFFVKKTDYEYYAEGEPGQPGQTAMVEGHEMTSMTPAQMAYMERRDKGDAYDLGAGGGPQATVETAQTQEGTKVIPPASNPFRKETNAATNPFNQ